MYLIFIYTWKSPFPLEFKTCHLIPNRHSFSSPLNLSSNPSLSYFALTHIQNSTIPNHPHCYFVPVYCHLLLRFFHSILIRTPVWPLPSFPSLQQPGDLLNLTDRVDHNCCYSIHPAMALIRLKVKVLTKTYKFLQIFSSFFSPQLSHLL